MISIDEFEERMIERLKSNSGHFSFDDFEQKILDMEENKIERYVRRKRRELVQTFINDYCTGIVHAESYHSELGNELGRDNPHLDYIAIINVGGKKISLRTIHDGIDVSDIANHFGGGGHAKASGCSLTEEAYKLYVAQPFYIEPLRLDAFRNKYNNKGSNNGCLYESIQQEKLYIYNSNNEWIIEKKGRSLDETFSSFEDAERHVKRYYSAWLVRDEIFVEYLIENVKELKKLREPLDDLQDDELNKAIYQLASQKNKQRNEFSSYSH